MAQKQSKSRHRVKEHLEEPESTVQHYRQAAMESVEEYPMAITLGAFGVGIGLGVLIASSFGRSHSCTMQAKAESIGRRVLDSLSEYIPASMRS